MGTSQSGTEMYQKQLRNLRRAGALPGRVQIDIRGMMIRCAVAFYMYDTEADFNTDFNAAIAEIESQTGHTFTQT
ncbi:hypothetical protein IQ255_21955 [Pleurocapsales cyanobacterium LEGE 10410]|nr:hypothetical protein [Pleurocapsales cyanobacterium LEGE 10410]